MTAIQKPVRRESATYYRGRPLIVEIHPSYVVLREKGRRQGVTVDYRAVLDLGYKLMARAAAAEKHARKGRK